MRLYLSSFGLGKHARRIPALIGGRHPRALAIMNALDNVPVVTRRNLYRSLRDEFAAIDVELEHLDLRDYFDRPDAIAQPLSRCDMVWANGGNAFTLRAAMRQSGFDRALKRLLEADVIVYGGYSAGAIVATPTLEGIELVDTCDARRALPLPYRAEIVWDGLGLVPFSIAPHFQSSHPESGKIDRVVAYFERQGIPYRTLRDGEAILINGEREEYLELAA